MAKYNIPASPTVYKSRYEGFSGCDFNTDPMCVDDKRFPYAQNLVLDTNGYPEKRPGYKEVLSFGGKVLKLCRVVVKGKAYLLVHAGNTVFVHSVTDGAVSSEALCTLPEVESCFFVAWNDKVYVYGIFTDGNGFVHKLEMNEAEVLSFSDAVPDAYVPETSIAGSVLTDDEYSKMKAIGEVSAGGQLYENINLVGIKRINTYKVQEYELSKGSATETDVPLVYSSALNVITDGYHGNSSFYKAVLGLYLRLYCFNSTDYYTPGGGFSYSSDYYSDWGKLYESGETAYQEYVQECGKFAYKSGNNGLFPSLLHSRTRCASEVLRKYAEDNFSMRDKGNYLLFYPKEEHGFKIEIFVQDIGFTEVPLFAFAKANLTGGVNSSFDYFYLLFDFGDYESFSSNTCFNRIRMLRAGFYYSKASELLDIGFVPDTASDVNIRITYTVSDESFQEGIKKIVSSDICRMYGVGGAADRVFVKGTGDEKHYVRFSDMDNPLYFPDLNYITCGSPSTAVIDMFPFSSYLCIAKEQNYQDVSFFLAEGTMISGEAAFLVKEGLPGVGLSEAGAFSLCEDIPHFLSDNGVFYLTSVDITAKATVKNCSYFADSMISNENPKGAKLFYYKKNLLLSFPESKHVYVFNTNDKVYSSRAGADHYVYEVWLWTDVEATDFICLDDTLYFVTKDGALMQFKEHGTVNCYSDEYDGEHHAIDAYFKTKAFDDGSFMTLKNMRKRGCGAALKPFVRSSATVYVITDRDERHLKDISADIFDWTYIDFVRFEFTANPAIRIMPFNTKVKKYATIQFFVRNNEVGESFGVIGLEKAYTLGNYKKN